MKSFIIELEDNKYEEFLGFCKLNSIEPEAFITKSFLEKYLLMKYGDLNEKVESGEKKKKETKKKPTVSKVSEEKTEEIVADPTKENTVIEEVKPKKKVRIIKSQ